VNGVRIGSIVAMVVPIACALIFGLMCQGQYKRRDLAMATEQQNQQQVQALQKMMDTINIDPLINKEIAAENTADEQASFLTQLRVDAQGAGIKLVDYMNGGNLPTPPNGQNQPQPTSHYRQVASTLTVQGPYEGVRAFAYSLLRSNRLMMMNGVTWKRDAEGASTTLSFTLIRYVKDTVTTATTTAAMATRTSSGGA